jgi:hypothetical protein
MRTVIGLLLAGVLGCGGEAVSEDPSGGAADPGKADGVVADADGYVLTPAGYYHRSCVYEIAPDDSVREDGTIDHVDGSSTRLAPCQFPIRRAAPAVVPTIDGWLEAADWMSPSPVTSLSARWTVPQAPAQAASQTLFFFPSVEPSGMDKIIQPVLQYGTSGAGGGAYWAIASWYVGEQALNSKLQKVNPGDRLSGVMTTQSCSAAGACSWTITTRDLTTNKSVQLKVTRPEPYPYVNGAVLEVYGVSDCGQLPANGPSTFTGIAVGGAAGALHPTWTSDLWAGATATPSCNYRVTSTANSASLAYR